MFACVYLWFCVDRKIHRQVGGEDLERLVRGSEWREGLGRFLRGGKTLQSGWKMHQEALQGGGRMDGTRFHRTDPLPREKSLTVALYRSVIHVGGDGAPPFAPPVRKLGHDRNREV